MSRKIISVKDENGQYVRQEVAPPVPVKDPDITVDAILERQILALARVTQNLTKRSQDPDMTPQEIQSLATCIKVTLELKAKEKELLSQLTDEELEKKLGNETV